MDEELTVKSGDGGLGVSDGSYCRHVRGMIDYKSHGRKTASTSRVLREVALKRVEAGHRRVRAYAIAWGTLARRGRQQSDELLPGLKTRGINPTQAHWP